MEAVNRGTAIIRGNTVHTSSKNKNSTSVQTTSLKHLGSIILIALSKGFYWSEMTREDMAGLVNASVEFVTWHLTLFL